MSLIKRTIEQEVRICDDCKKTDIGNAYDLEHNNLQNCFICGKDLCISHTFWLGGVVDGIALCKTHNKEIWKTIKKRKGELCGERK